MGGGRERRRRTGLVGGSVGLGHGGIGMEVLVRLAIGASISAIAVAMGPVGTSISVVAIDAVPIVLAL